VDGEFWYLDGFGTPFAVVGLSGVDPTINTSAIKASVALTLVLSKSAS
jgi:hypothetical protein